MTQARQVFITGLEKSGKTSLRRLLDAQPWIVMGRTRLWEDLADIRSVASLKAYLDKVSRQGLKFDREAAIHAIHQAPDASTAYITLLSILGTDRARDAGVIHWGEQAAELEHAADEVLHAHPDGMIVHLMRDPRDRFAESRRRSRPGGIGPATASWVQSFRWAQRNLRMHALSYQVVRYEDLVKDPASVIAMIAGRTGECPAPIDPALIPGIETVGRYRKELPSWSVAYIQDRAGEHIRSMGYELEQPKLDGIQALRLNLFARPSAAAMTLRWHRDHPGFVEAEPRHSPGQASAGKSARSADLPE